jgi:predicted RND superfamily exporter protein
LEGADFMETVQKFVLSLAGKPAVRWLLLFFLIVPTSMGLTRLAVSTDQNIFFGENNPEYLEYKLLEEAFGSDESIIFVVIAKNETILSAQNLAAIRDLTKRAWKIPNSRKVNSIANFQHSRAKDDGIFVGPLIDASAVINADTASKISAIASADPMINGLLLSRDKNAAAIIVTLDYAPDDPDAVPQIMQYSNMLRQEILAQNPDIEIALTGTAPISNAFQEASEKDAAALFPITIIIIMVGFYVTWRSFGAAIAPILIVIAASASTMGFAGWLEIPVTPLLAIVPVLLLTIGVADLVHLNNGFTRFAASMSLEEAVMRSYEHNMRPILITTLSTALGFFSFVFADSPPLRQFGVVATFGVLVTMLIALLGYAPVLNAYKRSIRRSIPNFRIWDYWCNVIERRPRIILVAGVSTIVAIALIGIPQITLDDRFDNYFDESFEARRDMEKARENLIGVYSVDFLISTGAENGIFEIPNLEEIDRFTSWLANQSSVAHVSSYTHVLKKLNKNFHADDPAHYRLPDTQEEAAQYFLAYSMSLPAGVDLNDTVNLDRSTVRITATTPEASAVDIRQLKNMAESWASDRAYSIDVSAVGIGVMTAYMSQRNIESMFAGTLAIVAIIAVILFACFRNFRFSMAGLVSNVLPIVVGFSLWGLLIGDIGMAAAIITALSLGLIVDDTVHFLTRYTEGRSARSPLLYVFENAGTAIIQTSIILFIGFLILAFSGFLINFTIGVLMMTIIASALFVDLLILPALLVITDKRQVT